MAEETFGTETTISGAVGFVVPPRGDVGFPQRFTARIVTDGAPLIATLDVSVDGMGRAACEGLQLDPVERSAVTAVTMRTVRIGDLLRVAMGAAAERVVVRDGRPIDFAPMTGADVYKVRGEAKLRRRRPSGEPDTERIRRAAELYRQASATPLQAVQDGLHVSRSTASRLVRAARDNGLLQPYEEDR